MIIKISELIIFTLACLLSNLFTLKSEKWASESKGIENMITFFSTKKLYIWRFELDGKLNSIELFASSISGKKKVVQNGQTIMADKKMKGPFQFPFKTGSSNCNIVQHGDKYELRINNQSFSHVWDNIRTKQAFNWDDTKQEDDPYKEKSYKDNYDAAVLANSRDYKHGAKGYGLDYNDDYRY